MTGQQMNAIALLVNGNLTHEDIAKQVNISSRTLRNWLHNEEFIKEYKKQLSFLFDSLSAQALNTLRELMEKSESDTVRMNCAKDILSRGGFDAKKNIALENETPIEINLTIG